MTSFLVRLYVKIIGGFAWWCLHRKTHDPRKAQCETLQKIIQAQKTTQFADEYHFEAISDLNSFRKQVPILDYETLRPFIEKQGLNNTANLNASPPMQFCQTSGTTSQAKYIPITAEIFKQLSKYSLLTAYQQSQAVPQIYNGAILSFSSPVIEGTNENGVPYGSMSGLLFSRLPKCLKHKYILPQEVLAISDYHSRYLLMAAFSLAEGNITVMNCANPSTLLKILATIQAHWKQLLHCLETSNLSSLELLPNLDISILQKAFHVKADRVKYLKGLVHSDKKLTFDTLWSNLQAIITWTSGSCGVLIPQLKQNLSQNTQILDPGFLASELVGTVTISSLYNQGLPFIDEALYEFISTQEWDNNRETVKCLLLDELVKGERYYIVVTTQNGLYRYFLNDMVEVGEFINRTPTIRFIQKGKGVVSLTGEKLYEAQLIEAMHQVLAHFKLDSDFYLMLGDPMSLQYILFLAHAPLDKLEVDFITVLDSALANINVEYKAKRESGRLKCVDIRYVKSKTDEAYKMHQVQSGQREGQFKMVKLQYAADNTFDFKAYQYES